MLCKCLSSSYYRMHKKSNIISPLACIKIGCIPFAKESSIAHLSGGLNFGLNHMTRKILLMLIGTSCNFSRELFNFVIFSVTTAHVQEQHANHFSL